ncbi:MAG: hypothetical protein CL908_25840, partial [Deltaproteobacteria bacterium]|nr:hypothetical protein [Deltaproteobacteria bacterium]
VRFEIEPTTTVIIRGGSGTSGHFSFRMIRTYFDATGIRIVDRTARDASTIVELRLASIGRSGSRREIGPGEVASLGPRVEIRRREVTEWYVNTPDGLEQGFTLPARPDGKGPLELVLAVDAARVEPRGDHLILRTPTGRRLEYAKLAVEDARGRSLAARLDAPKPDRIRIVADDREAAYPIVIDPLLTASFDSQLESDQASAMLGISVASAGDVDGDGFADVLVGAASFDAGEPDEGAAFIFLGSADGILDATPLSAHTQLESDQAGAGFGSSVSSAGDVNGDGYADVLVGATGYDADPPDEGAAFVFLGGATGIADAGPTGAHARLESDQADAAFGISVASAGDVDGDGYADILIGADHYDAGEPDEGAAFVFLGSLTGIANASPASAHAQLESDQADAHFGRSVSSASDVDGDGFDDILIGAPGYDWGEVDEGAAFVFLGSASGIADGDPVSADTQIEANQASAGMGTSVAGAGDVNGDGYADVILGAPLFDAGETDEGAAFVFLGSASGIPDAGAVDAAIQLEADQPEAQFGSSVASASDVDGDGFADVIVGAALFDAGEMDEGAAFVFLGGASGIADGDPEQAIASIRGGQTDAFLGSSVSSAGDIDGDGFDDVVVGAPFFDAGEPDEGAAFLFLGSPTGIASSDPDSAHARIEGDQAYAYLGSSVAGAGDIDRDGFDDIVIGVPRYDSGHMDEGSVLIFHGSATGIADGNPTSADTRIESNDSGSMLGTSVAGAGDVNGDGFTDILISAPNFDGAPVGAGTVFIYHGRISRIPNGNLGSASTTLLGSSPNTDFGSSVAGAGDVNADEFSDIVVGAPGFTNGEFNEGAAFVFYGSNIGIRDSDLGDADAQIESDQIGAALGRPVASAGDVNGDGYADIVVGSATFDAGEDNEGAAFVYLGSAAGITGSGPNTADGMLEGDQPGSRFGASVAGLGDVDGDGFADIAVGAWRYTTDSDREGAAFVFLGSPSGVPNGSPATAHAELVGDQADGAFGWNVSAAGDVNADGFADLLVGARRQNAVYSDEGSTYLYLANTRDDQPGRPVLVAQRCIDDLLSCPPGPGGLTRHVGSWSSSGAQDAFLAEIVVSHPEGTGRVKAEFEACLIGIPFGDSGCSVQTSPDWLLVDGASPEVRVQHILTGLPFEPDALYRWRVRALYAPTNVSEPGIVAPPEPRHGPWRRPSAQSNEADIRVPEAGFTSMLIVGALWLAAGAAAPTRRQRATTRSAGRSSPLPEPRRPHHRTGRGHRAFRRNLRQRTTHLRSNQR